MVYFEGFTFRYCKYLIFRFLVRWWSLDVSFNGTLENDSTKRLNFFCQIENSRHRDFFIQKGKELWGKLLCSRCLELDRGDLVPVVKDHPSTWKKRDPPYLVSPCLHLVTYRRQWLMTKLALVARWFLRSFTLAIPEFFRLRVRSLRFSASHCILKKGKSFRCISLRYPDAGGSRGCPGKTVGDHPPTALHGGAPGQKFRVPKGRQIGTLFGSSFDTSPWMMQMNWH